MKKLPPSVLKDDLVAAGLVGVFDALRRSDRGKWAESRTKVRIRGAMLDELRAEDWLSRRGRARARRYEEARGGADVVVRLDDLSPAEADALEESLGSPADELPRSVERAELVDAIESLSDREQLLVHAFFFQEVDRRRLARSLKTPTRRVAQDLARAIQKLQAKLGARAPVKRRRAAGKRG